MRDGVKVSSTYMAVWEGEVGYGLVTDVFAAFAGLAKLCLLVRVCGFFLAAYFA